MTPCSICFSQGQKTEAERYFLKAIQLDPTKGNCYMHYGKHGFVFSLCKFVNLTDPKSHTKAGTSLTLSCCLDNSVFSDPVAISSSNQPCLSVRTWSAGESREATVVSSDCSLWFCLMYGTWQFRHLSLSSYVISVWLAHDLRLLQGTLGFIYRFSRIEFLDNLTNELVPGLSVWNWILWWTNVFARCHRTGLRLTFKAIDESG